MDDSTVVFETKPLFGICSNGKYKLWKAHVETVDGGGARLVMTHGYEDGTLKSSVREVNTGKNIGRVNETTAEAQAISEAKSRFQKQLDKGYRENKSELTALPVRPMLAQSYMKNLSKVKDGTIYIAQPKIDGVRCICQRHGDALTFTSRHQKSFNKVLDKHKKLCAELLEVMPDGAIWDGELYVHGLELEDISSAVKAEGPNTKKLQYWVYDVVSDELQFERISRYRAILADRKNLKYVVPVPIDYVKTNDDIKAKQQSYLEQGFEGAMLRSYSAKYRQGFRSYDLLKYKNFREKEFTIIGATHSVNGEIIFMFHFAGEPFNAVPAWPSAKRKQAWAESDSFFGKKATVRFSDESKKGVPIGNPVVAAIRDYE